jgi:hypothetical protein
MKTLIKLSLIVTVLSLASCASDKKDDPLAPTPSSDARDKYTGIWLCNETSKISGSTSYTINISKSTSNVSEVKIDKFYDLIPQAYASISGNNVNIPYQQLGSLGFAKGTGLLSANGSTLSLAYTTEISGNKDTCTANCVKQ